MKIIESNGLTRLFSASAPLNEHHGLASQEGILDARSTPSEYDDCARLSGQNHFLVPCQFRLAALAKPQIGKPTPNRRMHSTTYSQLILAPPIHGPDCCWPCSFLAAYLGFQYGGYG